MLYFRDWATGTPGAVATAEMTRISNTRPRDGSLFRSTIIHACLNKDATIKHHQTENTFICMKKYTKKLIEILCNICKPTSWYSKTLVFDDISI